MNDDYKNSAEFFYKYSNLEIAIYTDYSENYYSLLRIVTYINI